MKGRCSCGSDVELVREGKAYRFVAHRCGLPASAGAVVTIPRGQDQRCSAGTPTQTFRWSAALPTQVLWPTGEVVTFPSKMEARVAERLLEEATRTGCRLYRQVRIPLLTAAPGPRGVPGYLTVDFALVSADGRVRFIDAKGGRKSREWKRGKASAEAMPVEWIRVEETDR